MDNDNESTPKEVLYKALDDYLETERKHLTPQEINVLEQRIQFVKDWIEEFNE